MGILEGIAEQLRQLQEAVVQLTAEVRAPAPPTNPLTAAEEIWADGAITVLDAVAFSGINRKEMFALMRSGDLPYANPTRTRLVPRRWLVQYLTKCASSS